MLLQLILAVVYFTIFDSFSFCRFKFSPFFQIAKIFLLNFLESRHCQKSVKENEELVPMIREKYSNTNKSWCGTKKVINRSNCLLNC